MTRWSSVVGSAVSSLASQRQSRRGCCRELKAAWPCRSLSMSVWTSRKPPGRVETKEEAAQDWIRCMHGYQINREMNRRSLGWRRNRVSLVRSRVASVYHNNGVAQQQRVGL